MTATAPTRTRPWTVSPARAIAFILMVGQFVSLLAFELLAAAPLDSGPEVSPIVPPGPMFAIWSLIYLLSAVWSVIQLRRSASNDGVRDAIAWPLAVTFGGVAVWQAAAAFGQTNWLTLPAFVIIVAGLVVALRTALRNGETIASWSRGERVLLFALLGTYLGWTSIAIFVNVATVVQANGAPIEGTWGTVWQSLVLLAAAGVAVFVTRWSGGVIAYAVTTVYAFTGAAISTALYGFPVLTAVCAVAILGVTATLLVTRLSGRAAERTA